MFRFLEYIMPGKARLKREIADARKDLEPLSENLVGWEGDELELMSLIQEERKVRSAFEVSITGIICSIYHEHMIAYEWKKLFGLGELEIIVANTKKYRYEYVTKQGRTSFYVNDQFLGEFRKDNRLYLTKRRILAELQVKNAEWWEVLVEGNYVGSLVNIDKARHVNPRAFRLQRGLSEEAEIVFLAVAIFKIVDITRRMKKYPFR